MEEKHNFITGFDLYYRCQGTGKPTKAHIVNPNTGISFCGYTGDPFAEYYDSEMFTTHKRDCCKKCLKKAGF